MPPISSQLFHTVRVPRASGDIVQQIKNNIFEGRLNPGDRLPPEKELAEQFAVSRTTVRDALRLLESQGLVIIKVGAAGGAFVACPSSEPVSRALTDMIRLNGATIAELVEARLVVETSMVTFAAERATREDFEAMQAAIDAARAAQASLNHRFTPHSVKFHNALARSAKNQVLLFTYESLQTLFYETLEKLVPDDTMAERAIEDHQAILNAIRAHDAPGACNVMRDHLEFFQERVRKLAG